MSEELFDKLVKSYWSLIESHGGLEKVLSNMREKYIVSNKLFLLQMFLYENGVNPSNTYLKQTFDNGNVLTPLELYRKGEGAVGVMEVVFGLVKSSFTYWACPYCWRKVPDGVCSVHGIVDAVEARFVTYFAASGEFVFDVKVPPRVASVYRDEDLVGKRVKGRFRVSKLGVDVNSTVFMLEKVLEVRDVGRG